MEKVLQYTPYVIAAIGGWTVLNGVLHEIFVLLSDHAKQYDRNLLRLLVDGLLLMSLGTVLLLLFGGLKNGDTTFAYIAIVCSGSIFIYCLLIFPFLPTVGMLILHAVSIVLVALTLIYKT